MEKSNIYIHNKFFWKKISTIGFGEVSWGREWHWDKWDISNDYHQETLVNEGPVHTDLIVFENE